MLNDVLIELPSNSFVFRYNQLKEIGSLELVLDKVGEWVAMALACAI